jgi:hypothetical protein
MRRSLLITTVLAALAFQCQANEGLDLSVRSKSMAASAAAATAIPASNAEAPFRTARDPLPELMMREEQERRGVRGSCDANATSLCYDLADGRIVYRGARNYMPKFDGLRAEAISLRRDRIVFKYSFK